MKRKIIILIVSVATFVATLFICMVGAYFFSNQKPEEDETPIEPPLRLEYGIPIDSFELETYTVKQGEFLSQILVNLGANESQIAQANLMSSEQFDVRTIRAGNVCKAFYQEKDSVYQLVYLVYAKNAADYVVMQWGDSLQVSIGQKEIDRRVRKSHVEINSSLWNAVVSNDISPVLAMDLSEIYAWTIDFFGLQKGDHFKAIYEELYVDSTFYAIGRIHAVEFVHAGKPHQVYHFVQDSVGSYWDENGNSLRRAFLKAPLKFSRISSHFSYARKHPVLRVVRPHTGVDYAAPMGTPVMSIGDGTVIERGYKGGGGHTVKIRHNSVYTTAYLHLSKYGEGINVGSRVAQGQVIGFVGSSGLSTGPHLDFRVWMNNKPVDPLTIESPPVEPIREENKVAFDSIRTKYNLQF